MRMTENRYLKNLTKLEFAVTFACIGRCIHCSEGTHAGRSESIDPAVAARAVTELSGAFRLKTVMAFGGEPMLAPEAVYAIMAAARDASVQRRQVITNGCFTRDPARMRETAQRLAECGVNDLLLSVDAFHQATLPIETVHAFAAEAVRCGIASRLSPAWLVSREDENPYNLLTRKLLLQMRDLGIPEGDGNVVFPEGNAKKYLSAYFKGDIPQNPYVEDPVDLRCLSVSPNGDLLDGNLYRESLASSLRRYAP